eukprot:6179257-Pleurochrysis_carterae.AAC.1
MGHEGTKEENDAFEVEAVVSKIVADGRTAYANLGKAAAGVVLYHISISAYRAPRCYGVRRRCPALTVAHGGGSGAAARIWRFLRASNASYISNETLADGLST